MADSYGGELLLHAADLTLKDNEFQEQATHVIEMLKALRADKIRDINDHLDFVSKFFGELEPAEEDEVGFPKPKPLTSQTSEPEK